MSAVALHAVARLAQQLQILHVVRTAFATRNNMVYSQIALTHMVTASSAGSVLSMVERIFRVRDLGRVDLLDILLPDEHYALLMQMRSHREEICCRHAFELERRLRAVPSDRQPQRTERIQKICEAQLVARRTYLAPVASVVPLAESL